MWVSEEVSLRVCALVCVRVCKRESGTAFVRRPITHPSCTSNESWRITALLWFGSGRNERDTSTAHLSTWTNTQTRKHAVYSNSSAGLRVALHKAVLLLMAAALPSRWGCNKNIDSGQTNSYRLTDRAETCRGEKKKALLKKIPILILTNK